MTSLPFLLPALLVLVVAAEVALLFLLLRTGWAMRLAPDVPNHRSLHAAITPRIGGMVIMPLALLPALVLFPGMRLIAVVGLALWLLSLIDDCRGLRVSVRLLVQAAAALAMLVFGNLAFPPLLGVIFFLLLLWSTNLYNFMDGADGLAGGMATTGFWAYGIASWHVAPELASLCFLLATVAFGFLIFNFAPARIFLGDAGSVPLGFLAAWLGFLGWQQHAWPAWFPLLVFSPFLVDATATLAKRIFRGEQVWQAHREHYYQRLVRMGWSHRRLAFAEYALMMASAASALLLQNVNSLVRHISLLAWVFIYALVMTTIDLCWEKYLKNTNNP